MNEYAVPKSSKYVQQIQPSETDVEFNLGRYLHKEVHTVVGSVL